jgi:hypothetical protein
MVGFWIWIALIVGWFAFKGIESIIVYFNASP